MRRRRRTRSGVTRVAATARDNAARTQEAQNACARRAARDMLGRAASFSVWHARTRGKDMHVAARVPQAFCVRHGLRCRRRQRAKWARARPAVQMRSAARHVARHDAKRLCATPVRAGVSPGAVALQQRSASIRLVMPRHDSNAAPREARRAYVSGVGMNAAPLASCRHAPLCAPRRMINASASQRHAACKGARGARAQRSGRSVRGKRY